jgi:cilia- and flagella-associated protein 44
MVLFIAFFHFRLFFDKFYRFYFPSVPNVVISERMLVELKELELRENENTAYEQDMLTQNHRKNLFKQDKILSKINQRIKMFDNELETLSEERLQVQVEAKFLDNYLLTLNQELWLLKDFEKLEEKLIVNVEDHIIARNSLHKSIQHIKASMEMKRKLIEKEKEGLKYIMSDFKNQCMGDKFSSFFKKIFKKKYRPQKEHDAGNF